VANVERNNKIAGIFAPSFGGGETNASGTLALGRGGLFSTDLTVFARLLLLHLTMGMTEIRFKVNRPIEFA
jgi:hypothetical protein